MNGFIHRDIKAANLLIDDDGTVLLGDLGVAADLTEDTSDVHSTSRTHSNFTIPSSAEIPQVNSSSVSTKRNISPAKRVLPIRPGMGKRKSFVGTVRFTCHSDLQCENNFLFSRVGWLQSLFRESNMMQKQIFGVSVLQRWS
jgi:serine/threonine protein kinase